MGLPLYLALSGEEWPLRGAVPPKTCWMACRFSPVGSTLLNLPPADFPGDLLILDDSTPPREACPEQILAQLQQLLHTQCFGALLLDFQRPGSPQTQAIARALVEGLSCPVATAAAYAQALPCPVFLPPIPLRRPVEACLRPWMGRELWLEAALEQETVVVTEDGAACSAGTADCQEPEAEDPALHCHYQVEVQENQAIFHIRRSREDFHSLLEEAERLGVKRAVGLWQEWK